ncbi:MAG: CHRD domain-containing protein [Candidatus Rokuibacteriota bacterium]
MKRCMISLFIALVGLLVVLGPPLLATATDGKEGKGRDDGVDLRATLRGFQEVPPVSTTASGSFKGEISDDGLSIEYSLSYSGLEGVVRQAHIHFGQRHVNGGIVIFLCQTTVNPDPTGLALTCPQSGTVTSVLTKANVANNANAQGIESSATGAGSTDAEFASIVQAIRAGVTYANVHSANAGGVAAKFNSGEIRGQIKTHRDGHDRR